MYGSCPAEMERDLLSLLLERAAEVTQVEGTPLFCGIGPCLPLPAVVALQSGS